jgi:hypothetical protein
VISTGIKDGKIERKVANKFDETNIFTLSTERTLPMP